MVKRSRKNHRDVEEIDAAIGLRLEKDSAVNSKERLLAAISKECIDPGNYPPFIGKSRWDKIYTFPCSNVRVLRKAIHYYLALANKSTDKHFSWNTVSNSPNYSDLGVRMILCLDLYQRQAIYPIDCEPYEPAWNSHVVHESANIYLFRRVLVRTARQICEKYGQNYLSRIKLAAEDIEALETAMQSVTTMMNRRGARNRNKHLYNEMYRTDKSISKHLQELNACCSCYIAVPVTFGFDTDQRYRLSIDELAKVNIPRDNHFPSNYLEGFRHVLQFLTLVKKDICSAIGHLARLTGGSSAYPNCVAVIFFSIGNEYNPSMLEAKLRFMWADYIFGTKDANLRTFLHAPGIALRVYRQLQGGDSAPDKGRNLNLMIEHIFVQDLQYQRVRLPKKRRTWSQSAYGRKAS